MGALLTYLVLLVAALVLMWLYFTLGVQTAAIREAAMGAGGDAEGVDLMGGLSMDDIAEAAQVAARAAAKRAEMAGAGGARGDEGGHDGGEL